MKKILQRISFLFCILFFSITASAQNKTITGKVSDESGAPILAASVIVKGTNLGTSTDINGDFTLSVPESEWPGLI